MTKKELQSFLSEVGETLINLTQATQDLDLVVMDLLRRLEVLKTEVQNSDESLYFDREEN